jgi:hypothetical protein
LYEPRICLERLRNISLDRESNTGPFDYEAGVVTALMQHSIKPFVLCSVYIRHAWQLILDRNCTYAPLLGGNWIFRFLQCVATKTTDAGRERNSFSAEENKIDRREDTYAVTSIRRKSLINRELHF